jgi:putative tryptophan/tyrosine transport system substrate-binding protein
MTRRQFIKILSGALVLWPQASHGQPPVIPVVGFLHSETPGPQKAAFEQGLKEGGYVVGQNVAIEYRWAEGNVEKLPALAADLVGRKVNVIAGVGGPPSNLAARNATTTIPVVFTTGADPIKLGLVSSLNRPGGNVTGVTFFAEELGGKSLGLLRELVPTVKTIGLLINPNNPATPRSSADTLAAAHKLGLTMVVVHASTPAEIDKAFDTLIERQAGALLIAADVFYSAHIQRLVSLVTSYKMPAMYYRREFPATGGLASYGTSVTDAYRQAGIYVARILNGDKPGELPVMQTVKFEFILNLKTARTLGIDVSMAFSAAADEIIE